MSQIFDRKKKQNNPPCKRCGAPTIPIVYGYPSESMFREAERGTIALGGCIISHDNPRFQCTAGCDAENIDEQIDNDWCDRKIGKSLNRFLEKYFFDKTETSDRPDQPSSRKVNLDDFENSVADPMNDFDEFCKYVFDYDHQLIELGIDFDDLSPFAG